MFKIKGFTVNGSVGLMLNRNEACIVWLSLLEDRQRAKNKQVSSVPDNTYIVTYTQKVHC